jgi:hyaluronan synthase
MVTFYLQLTDVIRGTGSFTLFMGVIAFVWVVWGVKAIVASSYRPSTAEVPDLATAVIIPVVDEPVEVFTAMLSLVVEQGPDEVLVVINGPENPTLEGICDHLGVKHVWTETPGKRNAVAVGVEATSAPIVVLVDSDTLWTEDTLSELCRPFADPEVGGATTRQLIFDPERNLVTRWAAWSEEVRNRTSMPAYSRVGTVGCLPGRTIAFRREVLEACMQDFLTDRFMGTHLEVSDDRSLTNYTLKQGYKTVFQETSLVYTDAPLQWRVFAKQQLRWARGSQYNTLRMLPWMLANARLLAFGFVADILLPFAVIGIWLSWGINSFIATPYDNSILAMVLGFGLGPVFNTFVLAATGMVLTLGMRQPWMLRKQARYLLPIAAVNTLLLVPIRAWGFMRCARNSGWGTRGGGFAGDGDSLAWQAVPFALGLSLLTGFTVLGVVLA